MKHAQRLSAAIIETLFVNLKTIGKEVQHE